jgi:hypothetical protein
MGRIDDLLERQGRELDRLADAQVRAVLAGYEDARRALLETLQNTPLSTSERAHRTRIALAQVEAGVGILRARMGQEMSRADVAAQNLAMRHLLGMIRAQEPHFIDGGSGIEVAVAGRLAAREGLALHKYALDRYGAQVVENIQRALVSGVVQGMTDHELAKHIAGASGSVLAGMRSRAELIVRMEMSRAYNDAHLESIRAFAELADDPSDPVLKKIDEYFDSRNHPFSRAAHGTTALPGEPFRVPVAAVASAAQSIGKSSKGVLWSQEGGSYVGDNLPAHFHERGRIIAWRASWDEGAKKPAPSPKAPDPTLAPKPAPKAPSPKKPPALPTLPPAAPAPAPIPIPARPQTPAEIVLHELVAPATGSNPGGVYRGTDGIERYVKRYTDSAQAHGEHLANRIYELLGLEAPVSQVFDDNGQAVYASDIITGTKTLQQAGLTAARARAVLEGFAADVLLGNWDAVGLSLDNILVGPGDKLTRIDNGGSLLMRAMAGRKPTGLLRDIPEWLGFFDPAKNPSYARVAAASGLTAAEQIASIEAQIRAVLDLRDRSGGWAAFVARHVPGLVGVDRTAIVEMLEARSAALESKLAVIERQRKIDALTARSYRTLSLVDARLHERDLIARRVALTTTEERAAIAYTGSQYRVINADARAGNTHALMADLDAAIAKGRLIEDIVTVRGLNSHPDIPSGALLRAGDVISEPGYTSTSLSSGSAFGGTYELRIRVPKETRALAVEDLTLHRGEHELILPRGSRLQVIGTTARGSDWVIDALLLPPGL